MRRKVSLIGLWIISLCLLGRLLLGLPAQAIPFTIAQAPPAPSVEELQRQQQQVEELQRQQQQIEQQRSQIIRERQRLQNLERAAEGNLGNLEQSIQTTNIQIKDYLFQVQLAKKRLKVLEEDLALAEKSYQQTQQATVTRLQFLQRQRRSQGWAVLLQSQNLNAFLQRRHQLKLVYQADRRVLVGLKDRADALKQQRLEVEGQKNQIALLTQQLLAQQSQFKAQAEAQQQLIQRLRVDRDALEAAEAQLARDSASMSALIQKRVAEQRAKAAAAARAGKPNPLVFGTGRMIMPNDGEITSPFGMRMHPILGYERLHAGIDFGGDYGSPIRAADSGTVIYAGWYGGYGNAVIIDHGNGLTTLYAHTSEFYVSEGQVVQRGQPIAAVGSTGLATGPHLHFEVRQEGEPIDPMQFF